MGRRRVSAGVALTVFVLGVGGVAATGSALLALVSSVALFAGLLAADRYPRWGDW